MYQIELIDKRIASTTNKIILSVSATFYFPRNIHLEQLLV